MPTINTLQFFVQGQKKHPIRNMLRAFMMNIVFTYFMIILANKSQRLIRSKPVVSSQDIYNMQVKQEPPSKQVVGVINSTCSHIVLGCPKMVVNNSQRKSLTRKKQVVSANYSTAKIIFLIFLGIWNCSMHSQSFLRKKHDWKKQIYHTIICLTPQFQIPTCDLKTKFLQ